VGVNGAYTEEGEGKFNTFIHKILRAYPKEIEVCDTELSISLGVGGNSDGNVLVGWFEVVIGVNLWVVNAMEEDHGAKEVIQGRTGIRGTRHITDSDSDLL
jgi:hypothetical protein